MIKSIELKNFKSIKKHRFPLRNLNVVAGLNGMGKSTFIQSLLLLRQSSGELSRGGLRLNGLLTKIGKTNDAFYQYSKEDEMVFNVSFKNGQRCDLTFAYEKEMDTFKRKGDALMDFNFGQSLFNDNFQYLSANRIEPKEIHEKSFSTVVSYRNVGIIGQYTAHFLNVYGNDDIAFENLSHPKSSSPDLKEQVNKWMGEISPGVRFNITEIPNSDYMLLDMQYEQPNLGFTNRFKPTNVGFGISYSLPVVTTLLAAKPRELIMIESPESHIHPKGQAALGKLLSLVAMNDVQVIVETHSDHVLNGVRVAAKEQDISPEDVMIFYFQKEILEREQFSKITNIEVDANGELSEYPKNLLEEWSNQLIKLV